MFDRPGERFWILIFKTGQQNSDPSFRLLGFAYARGNDSKCFVNTLKSLKNKVVSTLHHFLVVASNHQESERQLVNFDFQISIFGLLCARRSSIRNEIQHCNLKLKRIELLIQHSSFSLGRNCLFNQILCPPLYNLSIVSGAKGSIPWSGDSRNSYCRNDRTPKMSVFSEFSSFRAVSWRSAK